MYAGTVLLCSFGHDIDAYVWRCLDDVFSSGCECAHVSGFCLSFRQCVNVEKWGMVYVEKDILK